MNKVYACIDGLANTHAVIDWAAWAAQRMALPLEFLHALVRHPERAASADYSGAIGPDAQGSLLQDLSEQDAARSRQAIDAGRRLLASARQRAAGFGPMPMDARLRHGEFVATVAEIAADAALLVLGEHLHAQRQHRVHTEHHLERVIRAVDRPVLVAAAQAFDAPQRLVLAFDGQAGARRAVAALPHHPLCQGLPVLLAMAGPRTPAAQQLLEQARTDLAAAGKVVQTELLDGEPQQALPALVRAQGPALLVMGANGHPRWRQWIFGSTTATLLRLGEVPVLVLR